MSRSLIVLLALLDVLPFAAPAHAAGGPPAGVDAGRTGVTAAGDGSRYVTLPTEKGTLLARIRRAGGQVEASRLLPRALVIPAVAYDGTATGLSADGRTLVLAAPRSGFPRATLRLCRARRAAPAAALSRSGCEATSRSTRCRPTGSGPSHRADLASRPDPLRRPRL